MTAKLLLDTHILIWWMEQPARLSKDQLRALRNAARTDEPLGVSAITLVELSQLSVRATLAVIDIDSIFEKLESSPTIEIIPLSIATAREAASLAPTLRDPSDCVIVATARVHGLRLLTSDQRIIDSKLVPIVE
ncbi:MAG: type II toxin-antitoxin system VapC family toxin [Acidobacteriota bacterium]